MMANKTNSTPIRRDDGWKGYVNWTATPAEREKVVSLMGKDSYDPMEELLQLSESGYSTAFGYDEKSACHRLSVTGKSENCPNQGYTLSIRASSPERCLGLAVYYIAVLCERSDWLVDKKGDDVW
jgi:hypothetical protein